MSCEPEESCISLGCRWSCENFHEWWWTVGRELKENSPLNKFSAKNQK